MRGTPPNERGEMILTNGVECTNGTAFDLVPDGPFTNDVRNMEANGNIECVFNNDRILPQESDISVNNFVDNQTRKLKCWSTNADSLCNKIDELKATVSSNSPDVITVTEICPKNVRDVNIIATAIQIPGYDLFTNNMKKIGIAICDKGFACKYGGGARGRTCGGKPVG